MGELGLLIKPQEDKRNLQRLFSFFHFVFYNTLLEIYIYQHNKVHWDCISLEKLLLNSEQSDLPQQALQAVAPAELRLRSSLQP